jgi:hypothetical protein
MCKDHAEHNETLCQLLIKNGGYNDWVITTAFYSSLHYFKYKLFPYSKDGITHANFEAYYSHVIQKNSSNISKHKAQLDLVKQKCPINIYSAYRGLYDLCMTARYSDYNVSSGLAEASKKRLDSIKTYCCAA